MIRKTMALLAGLAVGAAGAFAGETDKPKPVWLALDDDAGPGRPVRLDVTRDGARAALAKGAAARGEKVAPVEGALAVGGMWKNRVAAAGREFTVLEIPGGGLAGGFGQATIPIVRKTFEIPHGVDVRVEAAARSVQEFALDAPLLPRQLPEKDGAAEPPPFRMDESFYRGEKHREPVWVELEKPVIVRGRRLVQAKFLPVAYDPAKRRIAAAASIRFRLVFDGPVSGRDTGRLKTAFYNGLAEGLAGVASGKTRRAAGIQPGGRKPAGAAPAAVAGREKYHMVRVKGAAPENVAALRDLGAAVEDAREVEAGEWELPVTDSELARLQAAGAALAVVQPDLESYYADVCAANLAALTGAAGTLEVPAAADAPTNMTYGSMGGFYNYAEILAALDRMHALYPSICSARVSIGRTAQGNDIWMVKISDNADTDEDEPEALVDATHHAREPGSYTAALYAMWHLLENYGRDPEATYLVNNRELYFVPVVNVDGLLYNEQGYPSGGGMWRKNRVRNSDGTYGVDLNRNYPYQWAYDNAGSSPTPGDESYRGTGPASELETRAMTNLVGRQAFGTAFSLHSYAGKYLFPYGYADVNPERYDVFKEYGALMAAENGYAYGQSYTILYAVNGNVRDWQLHEHGIVSFTSEVGNDGFWPPLEKILPEAAENLAGHLVLFWGAGGWPQFEALRVGSGSFSTGERAGLALTVRNRGVGATEPVTVRLCTADPLVTVVDGEAALGTIAGRACATNGADLFTVDVSPACPRGHTVVWEVTIEHGGFARTNVYEMTVGMEQGAEYLIVTADAYRDAVRPLADWKRQKGFRTEIVTVSRIGRTPELLKAYIARAYHGWAVPPEYLLLVGGDEDIPAYYVQAADVRSDSWYACVDGDDYFPDLAQGRLSVHTADQAATVVGKILRYDRDPDDGNWYTNALTAMQSTGYYQETAMHVYQYLRDQGMQMFDAISNTGGGLTSYTTTSYPHRLEVLNRYEPFRSGGWTVPTWITAQYASDAVGRQRIADAFNAGLGFALHRDHGLPAGWVYPPFNTNDVLALTNGVKTPVVLSINCLSGSFGYAPCFAETMQTHTNGGAVGVVAAIDPSWSGYNELLLHGIMDCLYPEYDSTYADPLRGASRRPAEALNAGKAYLYAFEGEDKPDDWMPFVAVESYMYLWFGDPEMMWRSQRPATLTVTHPTAVPGFAPTNVVVTVTAGATPVAGARVCISKAGGAGWWVALTDAAGLAAFPELTPTEIGEYDVVVTSQDGRPYRGTMAAQAAGPYAELVRPAPGSAVAADAGYVDVRWMDGSGAGIDVSTLDAADLTVSGVTVTGVSAAGGGIWRYAYSGSLSNRRVTVTFAAGQVRSLGGPWNPAQETGFLFDTQKPVGTLVSPAPGSRIRWNPAYVDVLWRDIGVGGLDETTLDTADIAIAGVTVTNVLGMGGSVYRYGYGGELPQGPIEVRFLAGAVQDAGGNGSAAGTNTFLMDRIFIAGHVRKDGAAAEAVTVRYTGMTAGVVTSAWDGAYQIPVTDGVYRVWAERQDWAAATQQVVTVTADVANVDFDFMTARVRGRVIDEMTGLGVEGATVSYAGELVGTVTSGSDGVYEVSRVFGGPATLTLTAAKAGYFASASVVTQAPPDATGVDLFVGYPDLRTSAADLEAQAGTGEVKAVTLILRNDGSRELAWNVWSGLPGRVLRDFSKPAEMPAIRGIAFDGTSVWLCSLATNRLYKVDPDGNPVGSLLVPGIGKPMDLAWDGTNMWMKQYYSGASGKFTAVNPTNGAKVAEFADPTSPASMYGVGVAFGQGRIWTYSRNPNNYTPVGYLVQINPVSGQVLAQAPFPDELAMSLWGMDYRDGSLWTANGPYNGSNTNRINRMDCSTTAILCSFPFPVPSPQGVCDAGGGHLWVATTGRVYLVESGELPWMSAAPAKGALGPGQTTNIVVSLDAAKAGEGTHAATLHFLSNDPNKPDVGVPVTFIVSASATNRPPTVSLAASPTNGVAPLAVAFAAAGSDLDGDALTYGWSFGDGATRAPAGAASIGHTYLAAGTYTVTVTANDGRGGGGAATAVVRVEPWSASLGDEAGGVPTLRFHSATGWLYTVEYRDSLVGTNGWTAWTNNLSGSGGVLDVVLDLSGAPERFYRVRAQGP